MQNLHHKIITTNAGKNKHLEIHRLLAFHNLCVMRLVRSTTGTVDILGLSADLLTLLYLWNFTATPVIFLYLH